MFQLVDMSSKFHQTETFTSFQLVGSSAESVAWMKIMKNKKESLVSDIPAGDGNIANLLVRSTLFQFGRYGFASNPILVGQLPGTALTQPVNHVCFSSSTYSLHKFRTFGKMILFNK